MVPSRSGFVVDRQGDEQRMGTGIFLAIVGAILAFAVRTEPRALDLDVVGLILMVAGGAIIYVTRRGQSRTREVVERDETGDATGGTHVVRETVTERDPYH